MIANKRCSPAPIRVLPALVTALILAVTVFSAGALEPVRGEVRLSNGRVLSGTIHIPPGGALAVLDRTAGRWFERSLAEVARVDTAVGSERMEKIVRPGGAITYPLRTYRAFVTFRDGTVVEGGVQAVLTVRDENGKETILRLLKQEKGRPGQALEDLVFVQGLDLSGGTVPPPERFLRFREARAAAGERRPSSGKPGFRMKGNLSGAREAVAVDLEKGVVYRAVLNRATGAYRIEGIRPGWLTLFIRYPGKILHGPLACTKGSPVASAPDPEGRPPQLLASLESLAADGREVDVLAAHVTGRAAKVLAFFHGKRAGAAGGRGALGSSPGVTLLSFAHSEGKGWILKQRLLLFRGTPGTEREWNGMKAREDRRLGRIPVTSARGAGEGPAPPPEERSLRFDYPPRKGPQLPERGHER